MTSSLLSLESPIPGPDKNKGLAYTSCYIIRNEGTRKFCTFLRTKIGRLKNVDQKRGADVKGRISLARIPTGANHGAVSSMAERAAEPRFALSGGAVEPVGCVLKDESAATKNKK